MPASTGHRNRNRKATVSMPRVYPHCSKTHFEHSRPAQQTSNSLKAGPRCPLFTSIKTAATAHSTFQYDLWSTKGKRNSSTPAHQGLVSILNLQGYQRKIIIMMMIKMERGIILPTLPRNVFPLKEFYFNICVVQHT